MSDMTPDQQLAFDLVRAGRSIFLTGEAGTGKSFVLQKIIADMGGSIGRTATTGAAASLIGADTAHRFFGMRPTLYKPGTAAISPRVYDRLESKRAVIVEEVSLARYDTIQNIYDILTQFGPVTENEPFGKQVIMTGDFSQLPPILSPADAAAYRHIYGQNIFAFEHPAWKGLVPVRLTTVHRQKDRVFSDWLGSLRHDREIDLSYINARVGSYDADSTILVATRAAAEEINEASLSRFTSRRIAFTGRTTGDVTHLKAAVKKNFELPEGARVIICANDSDKTYVNGSQGILLGMDEKVDHEGNRFPVDLVRLNGGHVVAVRRHTWDHITHAPVYNEDDIITDYKEKITGSFTQFPLLPAWAITIHRSQGMSISRLHVDTRGIFENGQAYVALSRACSYEGLTLEAPMRREHVMTHRKVLDYNRLIDGLPPLPKPKGLSGIARTRHDPVTDSYDL